ncbi:chemotaxis protein CheB [Rhodanobacter sp. 7MK24]|uniref:chemotaxis protein CheB n=1 Tax=Rhodanobacter sp. 7MK24 TaxID=2775922 RepID=UPI0017820D9F|nr:chemotaxis protein CheB [Rhodanobacter sp. 7MK24]MBD8879071.1 chemotaxis protein CheB [Rhodanobacter sp. 7MK24]
MVEALPSVALLFDDAELGGHLRQTLQERGARIVHEGAVAGFDAGLLRQLDPDVLVVNLDEEDDEAFDRLFGMVEGDHPRLVLNDARASRALDGWDRARWARHLAMKVLASGDVDPPRPADAQTVETLPAIAPAAEATEALAFEPTEAEQASAEPETMHASESAEQYGDAAGHEADDRAASDDLEAELAALLAAPEPALPSEPLADAPPALPEADVHAAAEQVAFHGEADEHAEHGLAATDDLEAELAALLAGEIELPHEDFAPAVPRHELPLHDGSFGVAQQDDAPHQSLPLPEEQSAPFPQVDEVSPASAAASDVTASAPAAPDNWALVDHDDVAAAPAPPAKVDDFGIQKVSAADYLAPDVEPATEDFKPTLTLELVSLEEAVAPTEWEPTEMLLDDLGGALSRVVLLGASADGLDSVCEFLASLPAGARHAILLTQHFGAQPVDTVLQRLLERSSLPVRLARHGGRARAGEVLLVPAAAQVQLRRDGSIELRTRDDAPEPSIDASFTMAASAFGRDALGIVFAGRSTDAVAGAQAIHDRNGQVWVESADGGYSADMVGAIFAERLVSYSGTLHELAAHLIEVYP